MSEAALSIFLSSVHRAAEHTGIKPSVNIVSKALFDRICDETMITARMDLPLPIGPQDGFGQLCGYPVRVVDSPHLFALSFDRDALAFDL